MLGINDTTVKTDVIEITKRDGRKEAWEPLKIRRALERAYLSVDQDVSPETLDQLTENIANKAVSNESLTVEAVQDLAEEALMQAGAYDVARAYILYRKERSEKREVRHRFEELIAIPEIHDILRGTEQDFTEEAYETKRLLARYEATRKPEADEEEVLDTLLQAAIELVSQDAPRWEMIAARIAALIHNREVEAFEEANGIKSFYEKIVYLTKAGLYGEYILDAYAQEEIEELSKLIDPIRDQELNFSGYELLTARYTIRTHDHEAVETVQEMFLGIALHLAMKEDTATRHEWVERFYGIMSMLQVTMATPTLSNARKPFHQLSSCFIDTVEDSLDGIYRSITNFAQVSKYGGGMGLYFGKVRAVGSSIRGFKGVAGGVIRWIKLANDTAVAVDQLGMRQGSVACYLDIWHKDVPEFIQVRTNSGDDRLKAHDIFPALSFPDLFWRKVEENLDQDWHLFCPHEIYQVKGYHLEDSYGKEWEEKYLDIVADERISRRVVSLKEMVRIIIKSLVETGTPFVFNRDAVNEANPNKHKGMIYSSNLCTEIMQNMSAIEHVSTTIKSEDGDDIVVTQTKAGDFVVCNLASLVLGRIDFEQEGELRRITETAVRALDNVIDLNFYPLPYAQITNQKYRSIGLGVSGYHHLLAKEHIIWESEKHLEYADNLFEEINYETIRASNLIAKEKGSYDHFEGSDWETGEYFTQRGYDTERWQELATEVRETGLRNGYLIAVAPTSSTSIIAGTTAGLDPIMRRFFLEEKKGALLPRVAPDLSIDTQWYYKQAHTIDQTWSVRAAGIRQRHIDQAQSLNIYVTPENTFREILGYYIEAWRNGMKTVYYCRSLSLEVDVCESCAS